MASMTDEEADYWDEFFTENPPKLGPNGSGFLTRRAFRQAGVDDVSFDYLVVRAEAAHQSVGQVINALVRKELAAQTETDHRPSAEIIGGLVREKIAAAV